MSDDRPEGMQRVDAPLYMARYRARATASVPEETADTSVPLYIRRFRGRAAVTAAPARPLWERAPLAVQRALTEDNRNKEISAPPSAARPMANDVFLIRHGETQGYSTDSGLTPQGVWQAHTYGQTLARRLRSGERVVVRHAATARARETAENIERGLGDGLHQYEKRADVDGPEPMDEFRNFQFVSPEGLRDVTAAFRHFYAVREDYERRATGERPLWLVEMDRFWRLQQAGGDPIQHWLTTPLVHFEPPAMCVRRFWKGILGLAAGHPGSRLMIATHSGPIRAFATFALGYDPGEPYNTEHVRVKLMDGGSTALITYRNRVQELQVPDLDALPVWGREEVGSSGR